MNRVFDGTHLHEMADAICDILCEMEPRDIMFRELEDEESYIDRYRIRPFIRDELNSRFGYGKMLFGESNHFIRYPYYVQEIELVFKTETAQHICGYLRTEDDWTTVSFSIEDLNHTVLDSYPTVVLSVPHPQTESNSNS